jgi:hypothetical protein
MNRFQEYKYFRRWTAVVRANHWRMSDCRLVPEAVRNAGEHHVAVWAIAEKIAEQECRAVIPDDLRHACHIHACGRDLPHKRMNDQQFDRLLLLWGDEREYPGLLIEPDHIASVMAWDNPDEARRQSSIAYLRQLAPEDVIVAIASTAGFGDDWEGLQRDDLQALARIIRARGGRRNREERIDPANVPF